jgi:hypothetical protein
VPVLSRVLRDSHVAASSSYLGWVLGQQVMPYHSLSQGSPRWVLLIALVVLFMLPDSLSRRPELRSFGSTTQLVLWSQFGPSVAL